MTATTTMTTERAIFRLAHQVQERLHQQGARQFHELDSHVAALLDYQGRLESARRHLAVCLSRGWKLAAQQVAGRIQMTARDISHVLSLIDRTMEPRKVSPPRLGDIVAELSQLEEEFPEARRSVKARTISVVTEPIELQGVYLGPFEIRLDLASLSQPRPIFNVIALDPHPASANEAVTHPHVSDERLCTGEAAFPIRMALQAGRLADFFCIVRSVLETYNPSSPYISLDSWEGQPCQDCGDVVSGDDVYYCTSCDQDFCGECASSCNHCGDTTCQGCLHKCSVCGEYYCRRCMNTCPDCNERICRDCLEGGQCPCQDEPQEQEDEQAPTDEGQDGDITPRAENAQSSDEPQRPQAA